MSLHYLADLFLCLFHAAEIGEPLRWHITNDFDRSWCRSLNRPANSDGGCSTPSSWSRQENPEERNDPTDRSSVPKSRIHSAAKGWITLC